MPVAEVARQMLDAYPREFSVDRGLLVRCIEACYGCAESCTQCADDCLGEESVQPPNRLDAEVTSAVLRACIQACRSCADECEIHAANGMEHCKVCAEECRRCEQACHELLTAIA